MATASEQPPGPERPRFAAAALTTLATRMAVAALSFASILIVARTLGPTGRGEVALLTTIAMVSSQLARLGVEEANINVAGTEPANRPALATNSVVLALAAGGGCAGLLAAVIAVFPAVGGGADPALVGLALVSIPVLVLQPYLTFLIRADYRFGVTNASWLAAPAATAVVNGALALAGGLTVATAFGTWVVAHALATVLLAVYLPVRLAGFGRPSLALARRTLTFGLRAHLGRVLMVGNYRVDQWFVGALAGRRELGLYSVAVAWAEILFYLPTVLVPVQRPYLVRSQAGEAARRAARVFRAGLVVTVPLAGLLVVLAGPLCTAVFGADFAGAVDDLRILALGAFGVVALQQLGNALTAQRRPELASVAAALAFAVTIALDVLLIPRYGGAGAAVASVASYLAGGAAVLVLFLRHFDVPLRALTPRVRDVPEVAEQARTALGRRRGGRSRGRPTDTR